jgi:DhnA family fructose-bisphosphate aldolase class Ia
VKAFRLNRLFNTRSSRCLSVALVRRAAELGADVIKADPTDDVSLYRHVVEIADRVPVLVRGGGKAPDAEILTRAEKLIQQGAAGIVYGRNTIQHHDPVGMTRALMATMHAGARAQEAAKFITAVCVEIGHSRGGTSKPGNHSIAANR